MLVAKAGSMPTERAGRKSFSFPAPGLADSSSVNHASKDATTCPSVDLNRAV